MALNLKECHPRCVYQNYSRSKIREVAVKNTTIFVYFLLGISPASNCSWPTFRKPVSVPSSKPLKMELTQGSKMSANYNLTPGKYPKEHIQYSETELTLGHMVLSGVPRKKSLVTPPGIDPGTVRLAAQRLNHYTTPGPLYSKYIL